MYLPTDVSLALGRGFARSHLVPRLIKIEVRARVDRIIKPLGQGTFGKVVCAWDAHKLVEVAVKVM